MFTPGEGPLFLLVEDANHPLKSISASPTPRVNQPMIPWLSQSQIHPQNPLIHRSAVIVQCMARMSTPTETLTSPAKRREQENKTSRKET